MTKRDLRKKHLEAHYKALERLAHKCGLEKVDGKKFSVRLFGLERLADKWAEDYCNGVIPEDVYNVRKQDITLGVQSLFNGKLKGFFVNSDPRGYALKIKSEVLQSEYADIGLQRDWGGYGLLSPEIE